MKNLTPMKAVIARIFWMRKAISVFGICVLALFLIFALLYGGSDDGSVGVDSSSSMVLWIFSFNPAGREYQIISQDDDFERGIYFASGNEDNFDGTGKDAAKHGGNPKNSSENIPSKSTEGISSSSSGKQSKPGVSYGSKFEGNKEAAKLRSWLDGECDIFNGRWVKDDSKPLYRPRSCPFIDPDFNCHDNGRPDEGFLKWRWQPNECEIPRFNAEDFLERLKDQRLIFVGDSLNRNMWESLVCILRQTVKNKTRVYEMSGRRQFKTSGYYSFVFKDYNCSVDFVRSPFLVKEVFNGSHVAESDRLRLDLMDETISAYRMADIVVFNTGHWWTHEKTSKGENYYQEGDRVYATLDVIEAYKKALLTWGRWVDDNIDPGKTQVVFRGYSHTHFSGGQWNSGGQCHAETEPITNELFTREHPQKMKVLEQVLQRMTTPVLYLNVSRLTDYRKDAHPSIYRPSLNAQKSQDCSHWCLPGVPDTWNQLLYASLLKSGKGSWGPR